MAQSGCARWRKTWRVVQLHVADFSYTRSLSLARPKHTWRSRLVQAFDAFLLANGDGGLS